MNSLDDSALRTNDKPDVRRRRHSRAGSKASVASTQQSSPGFLPRARPRPLLHALIVAALVAGGGVAASWTAAELTLVRIRATVDAWTAGTREPVLAEWQTQQARHNRVLWLSAADSEQLRLQGMLQEWRLLVVDSPVTATAELAAIRSEAIAAYRQSAYLRPAWAAGWAYLARQKALAGEHDDELLDALERALTLGPGEREIHLLVTDVATLAWPWIAQHADLRDQVIGSIRQSLAPPDTEATLQHLIPIIDRNRQADLCPLLNLPQASPWTQEACEWQPD